jgi:ElaB/YqjD/DUF883 family membrane-anchored ribosome-binding protein
MNNTIENNETDAGKFSRETGEFISSTLEAGGETYRQAKASLGGVKDSGRRLLTDMKENLADRARAADSFVQVNFHVAIVAGIATGALIGLILGWRLTRSACPAKG